MKIQKEYINDFFDNLCKSSIANSPTAKIDIAMMLMEARGKYLLDRTDGYTDLFIDPNVDIVKKSVVFTIVGVALPKNNARVPRPCGSPSRSGFINSN